MMETMQVWGNLENLSGSLPSIFAGILVVIIFMIIIFMIVGTNIMWEKNADLPLWRGPVLVILEMVDGTVLLLVLLGLFV